MCVEEKVKVKCKNQDIKVSAIIPVRMNEKPLKHRLKSLEEQTIKPYEIIVVPDEGKGQSYARTKGALQAKGKLLLFVDRDIIAKKDVLEQVLKKKEERIESYSFEGWSAQYRWFGYWDWNLQVLWSSFFILLIFMMWYFIL